jgi:hypothetical protein
MIRNKIRLRSKDELTIDVRVREDKGSIDVVQELCLDVVRIDQTES